MTKMKNAVQVEQETVWIRFCISQKLEMWKIGHFIHCPSRTDCSDVGELMVFGLLTCSQDILPLITSQKSSNNCSPLLEALNGQNSGPLEIWKTKMWPERFCVSNSFFCRQRYSWSMNHTQSQWQFKLCFQLLYSQVNEVKILL